MRGRGRPLVLLIKVYSWHGPMLTRILPLLSPATESVSVEAHALRAGWRPSRAPALVVVADAGAIHELRMIFPHARFMHVGHGLISKKETGYHYHQADYVCVASDAVAAQLTKRGHTPRCAYLATGLIQMDPLFCPMDGFRALKIPDVRSSVIYAPTWNSSLSSAGMFGTNLIQLLRGQDEKIGILIKPHPHIPVAHPEWIGWWTRMASEYPNVMLASAESDLVPALLGADMMVSDASSALFQFLALDRPMVLVDNNERYTTPDCFDPDGIEWQWRDIGVRVDDVSKVASSVRECLQSQTSPAGDVQRNARQRRRQELFGCATDGRAAERVAQAIEDIVLRGAPALRSKR